MKKIKISHPSLKLVKHIEDNTATIILDGKEVKINLEELETIKNELNLLQDMKESCSLHNFLRANFEWKYYHDSLRENVSKFLIGKEKINLEKDYDELFNTQHIPYMQLKNIYETFERFKLVSPNGTVLIKSLDDLIEPKIEHIN